MQSSMQTTGSRAIKYYLAHDIEVFPVGPDAWRCISAGGAIDLLGQSASLVIEQLMPLLKNGCSWRRLANNVTGVERAELRHIFDSLVLKGIVRTSKGPSLLDTALAPLLSLLDDLQLPAAVAMERLAAARIAIIGLEGCASYLALLLARCGVRRFTLVDPYPCQPGNIQLMPFGGPHTVGEARQAIVAAGLRAANPALHDSDLILGPATLAEDAVAALVASSDIVVSSFDRGFATIHHWVNRASLRNSVPAVYAAAMNTQGWAGPLVLPGKTACYMCYCMRAVACADDCRAALAYEQYLDQQRLPRLHERAVFPSLIPQLAGLLATTVLQTVLGFEQPALAGRILECQAFSGATTGHAILQHPECPDCGRSWEATHPGMADLVKDGDHTADIATLAPQLISAQTGIVREVGWYEKDDTEPEIPIISRVVLADHHFQGADAAPDLTCWGKGLTHDEARVRGLGEAVERYAADFVDESKIVHARRADLEGPSLDPPELVLYAPEQYATLPYSPYDESNVLGWAPGYSLLTERPTYVPALATFLGYQARRREEYLFPPTSNGLAAGASLVRAILAAAYEVMERDAFMITWLWRLPTRRINPRDHPDRAVQALYHAYQRRGVEIGLWQLPTDQPCSVFLALALGTATNPEPAVIAGLGADLCPAAASRKAIMEMGQVRPGYLRNLRRPSVQQRLAELVQNPQLVSSAHDHGLLYCSVLLRPALNFLLDLVPESPNWGQYIRQPPVAQLERLVQHFRESGGDFLYYNLTPPDIKRLGLAVVRVILPGFQPIAFGAQEERLGGTRLYQLPQQLGLAKNCLTKDDLNPHPHPLD